MIQLPIARQSLYLHDQSGWCSPIPGVALQRSPVDMRVCGMLFQIEKRSLRSRFSASKEGFRHYCFSSVRFPTSYSVTNVPADSVHPSIN